MATIPQPKLLDIPFANSGLKTSNIPNNDDSGVGNASWEKGFPEETMRLIADGGVPPHGQDMNGVLNQLCLILQYLQSGTLFKYNSTFATAIGGYPKGALVLSTDKVTLWRSTVDGNTTNPDAGGAGWVNFLADLGLYLPLAGGTMTGRITSTNASVPIAFTNISSGAYRDIQAVRSDTTKRIGVLRFNTTSTTNVVTIGASDAMDSAPSGVTVTRTLGDGNTAGTVTVTVATTPATTAKDKQVATTEYVKNCVPKSIGSATKLTYTNGDGVLTASNSTVGATNKPVFLSSGTITAISDTIGSTTKPIYVNAGVLTESNATVGSASKPLYLNAGVLTQCSSSLTDYLPLAGGYMDNGAQIFLTENSFSLDNTYTTDKEATGLVYRLKQTKDDNTAATYKGGMLALHAAQMANSRNLQVGWRIANPRNGNNPSAGTDDGVTINTGNCWSKIGLRYYFDINRAYAFSLEHPPLKGASTKYYSQYHLVTHSNLEHFLTRDGNANYPLSGTIPSVVGDIVKRTVDNSWARINGGTAYSDGANILLYGINSSSNAGLFQLQSRASASTSWQLKGDNTGLLSWNGSILNTGGVIVNQKNHFRIKDTDYAYNEVPSADSHLSFARVDKNNANVGRLQISRYATTGNQQVHLVVNSPVDGSEKVFLRGIQDSSGNHWVEISETRTTGTSDKEPVTVGYLNSRLGSYLPLAGGTMTGQIKTSYTDALVKTADNGHLTIIGGTAYANGASIKLSGKSETNAQGWFQVRAQDGTNYKDLIGKPDGTLTWNSSDVYVENRTNVSTVGPAITRSGTANWLRFTGGETDYDDGASIILYGRTHSTNAGNFNLSAFNGTNRYNLSGNASTGVLSWNGSVYLPNDGVYGADLTGKTIDLNDCYSTISGAVKLFHCNTDGGADNISNYPEKKAFILVSYTPRRLSASDYVIHQHFYCIGAHYSRRCTSGTWTSWILDIGASSASLGDANTPVYLSNGVLTSTGKSFANYLPLSGGTMTGNISKKYTALTKGTNPSSTTWHTDFITLDNGGTASANRLFEIRGAVDSTGYNRAEMLAYDFTSGSSDSNVLTVGKLLNGARRTEINNATIRIDDHKIMRNATNGWMRLTGGSTDNSGGGSLLLYGKEASSHEGQAILQAHNGTNYTNLTLNATSQAVLSTALKVAGGNNAIANTGLTVSGTNTNYSVKLQSTGFTKGTSNATTYRGTVEFYGNTMTKWQDRVGCLEFSAVSNKSQSQLVAYNITSAENAATSYIRAIVDASGNAYTETLTPAAGDNSTKIATTAFVRGQVPASLGGGKKLLQTGSNGVVAESTSSVGSANQPAYLGSGELKACTMNSSSAAGLARVTNQEFGVYGSNGQSDANQNSEGFSYGYVKYSNGLILQWGCDFCYNNNHVDVSFRTPFVNNPQITFSYNYGGDYQKTIRTISNTGFTIYNDKDASSALVKWFAIGI